MKTVVVQGEALQVLLKVHALLEEGHARVEKMQAEVRREIDTLIDLQRNTLEQVATKMGRAGRFRIDATHLADTGIAFLVETDQGHEVAESSVLRERLKRAVETSLN